MTPDEEAWEWIERLYTSASPEADRAKELLDWRDEQEDAQAALDAIDEKIGDIDKAAERLVNEEAIEAWAEQDERLSAITGDDLPARLTLLSEQHDRLEQQVFDLHDLCVEAGLLARNDHETDPLPLLRMFLPV